MFRSKASVRVVGALLVLVSGCGDSTEAKELRQSSSQAWQDLKQYAISERAVLEAALEERLEDLDGRIELLKAGVDETGRELGQKASELRAVAAEKLTRFEQASAENWERAKVELLEAVEELERATRRVSGDR